jgi:hypothetical protein
VPQVLRVLNLLAVAVWLGATVFLTFGVGPALFSPAMLQVIPKYHAGRAAQIFFASFFEFQLACGGLAAVLLAVDWAATGRRPRAWTGVLLAGLLGLVLLGGLGLQPRLNGWHAVMYAPNTSVEQKTEAQAQFRRWHGISQVGNLLVLAGVLVYFCQLSVPPAPRAASKWP